MPQYMLLIYTPVDGPATGSDPEESAKWFEYTQALQEAGVRVAGDALQGVDTATTVRVRDGDTQIVDGPFAETKEFLAGYYILDCPDLDTALGWARKLGGQPSLAIERIKRVSHKADLDEGIAAEKQAFGDVFQSEDAREGISAFLQKRTARFKGK